jgi:hypothetical protein
MNLNKMSVGQRSKKYQALLLVLATPLFGSRVPGGQGIIVNPSTVPNLLPPVVQEAEAENEMNVFVPFGSMTDETLPKPFQYGMVTLRPHVGYSFLYGDGIQASPTNHQSTAIQQLSPGIAMDVGRHWTIDYTPTARFYSNNQFKDGVDHAVSVVGGTHYEDWVLGLTQNFLYTTAPTSETGAQTEQESFVTGLTASHSLSEKTSVDLALNQNLSYADNLQNSRSWSTMDYLNYQFWPRLSVGIGLGGGYVNVDYGPDQTFEQLQARVNWRATDKISFQLSAGVEDLQYSASSQPDMLTPTFSASIQYLPFRDTQITVSANRSIAPSVIPGSQSTSTGFSASLTQTLFKKFLLSLTAGYTTSKYTELAEKDFIFFGLKLPTYYLQNRTDDNYSLGARLSHPFLRRGTVAVFYQYTDNQSSESAFSFRGNQVGVEISYRY